MLRELFESRQAEGTTSARGGARDRLVRAYIAFWRLGEAAPVEAYHSAIAEVRAAETSLPEAQIRIILKEASVAWYRETGRCPFCGGPSLHSPAEAILEGAV